jgi:azurin
MFVGMTSRGWAATGKSPFGVQRLVWTGKTPFEMKTIRSKPDGFDIEFTMPVDRKTGEDPASYSLNSFTYKYHSTYGSPIEDARPVPVRAVMLSPDGRTARVVADTALRRGYIYEVKAEGVKSVSGALALLHNTGYYTLNAIAPGELANVPARLLASTSSMHDHSAMMASTSDKAGIRAKSTGKGAKAIPAKAVSSAKRTVDMPATWTNGPDQTISIGTKPGLKFDTEKIDVKAGSRIKFVFNNNDDMLHNCVIVKPGTANAVGNQALRLNLNGPKMNYVPASSDVLFHTNILQPESAESIYFTAPTEPGDYQFVCTFPGHSSLMQGTLRVVK